jgi:CheY-like chemotaxis protein
MATLIIAEDEPILASLMKSELEHAGHIVYSAINGKQAWDYLEQEDVHVDAILSDLLMPEMNGYELLEKVRADERFKEIPCLVLSNSGQINDLNRAYESGANDVLIKANFNPDQLIGKVETLLQLHKKASTVGESSNS